MRPQTGFCDSIQSVSSEVFVTPSGIAPASTRRWTAVAERSATTSRRPSEPDVWGIPSSANDSLIVHGTPSSGGRSSSVPAAATRSSAASASARAASKRVATIALMRGLTASTSAMCSSTTSRARSSPARIAAANSSAELSVTGRPEAARTVIPARVSTPIHSRRWSKARRI